MPRLTISLSDERNERITEMVENEGYDSKSAAVNALIDDGERVESLEVENERLRNEKRAVIQQRDEHRELVEYVEREKRLQLGEIERRNAPIWRRIEWFVMGKR